MTLHIIIPVYNTAQYLPDALNSILSERTSAAFNVQLVLINDGSSDNSDMICRECAHSYPGIHYISQENQGVSVARNTGLRYILDHCAEDDWIGFLDSDDIYHTGWASAIESGLYSDSDVIGFGMSLADNRLNVSQTRLPVPGKISGGFGASVSENRKSHFGSYFYKCSMIRSHRIFFIPKVTNGEDLIFKYEAFLCANQLTYYPSPLYVYRKNEHSVTSNYIRNACSYYGVLFGGWHGYRNWLESAGKSEDVSKAIAFVNQRINCTCMFAARNYCMWRNGSYTDFRKDILEELLPVYLILPAQYEDHNLQKDYQMISSRPWLFYAKYFIKGLVCRS